MSRRLVTSIMITDVLFLSYWFVSALAAAGVMRLPPELMYADYGSPIVVAWNWSFLPLDVAFSALGLASVAAARRGSPTWRPLALLSLAFTIAAGGLAISYWTLLGEFNPSWFLPNLALVIWPLFFLPSLVLGTSQQAVPHLYK